MVVLGAEQQIDNARNVWRSDGNTIPVQRLQTRAGMMAGSRLTFWLSLTYRQLGFACQASQTVRLGMDLRVRPAHCPAEPGDQPRAETSTSVRRRFSESPHATTRDLRRPHSNLSHVFWQLYTT